MLLCWKFSNEPELREATKTYFGDLAWQGALTSAAEQARQSAKRKNNSQEELFIGLYLSESGLRYFDWPTEENGLAGLHFSENFPGGSFIDMAYKKEIDAVLCLAHDKKPVLDIKARYYRTFLEQNLGAELVAFENGRILKNKKGQSIEPFGYPDGISQAVFLDHNASGLKSVEQVAVPEPTDPDAPEASYGSYLTYLKLEQNVRRFNDLEKEITSRLDKVGFPLNNTIGAMVIGRTEQGVPLTGAGKNGIDDFDYAEDKDGVGCPFHAHIRKMNPRDSKKPVPLIVRRGVSFGNFPGNYSAKAEEAANLTGETGLLFMSFQASTDAFLHFWNKASLVTDGADGASITGADPIIGFAADIIPEEKKNEMFKHSYQFKNGKNIETIAAPGFGGTVKLRGALQLYAPSLTFFKKLNPVIASRNAMASSKNSAMPGKILQPFKLFGEADDAFLQTIIRYHANKAALDSDVLAYNYNQETHGPGTPPPDKSGYLETYTQGLGQNDELAFEFHFPVRKGDVISLKAEMVDWDTGDVAAIHYNDLNTPDNPRSGKSVDFNSQFTPVDPVVGSSEVQIKFENPNINHGYCRMLMAGANDHPLQDILYHDIQGKEIKRYILRVKSKIFPYEYTGGVAYLREDSILIVIKRRGAPD